MRYLVTGGLGYAGAWIARHLAQAGHTVFILSRSNKTPNIGAPYTLIQGDLAEQSPEELAQILPEALDGCVHAASYNEQFHDNYPKTALKVNALGTRNLLASFVLQAKNCFSMQPLPLVVYCSTFHVYGKTSGEVTETTPPEPQNDYALTHFFGEQYCHLFMRQENLPFIVVRMTNCYGAPACLPFSKDYLIINDLCRQAVQKKAITVNANPAIQRDFIWLGDVARCYERLLQRRDLTGQVLHLASGIPKPLKEIAKTVAAQAELLFGTRIPITYKNPEKPAPLLHVNTTKTQNALGYHLTNPLAEEIAATLHFFSHNPT